ncbi:hypothetical protein RDI58_021956 [Solanum bulbocastanum]|uniref:Uncharacterized protein n=1 Tax=Solanum bulbocastanum TaxID=147425 RepID=A0AAN8Y5D3_SOLBU
MGRGRPHRDTQKHRDEEISHGIAMNSIKP